MVSILKIVLMGIHDTENDVVILDGKVPADVLSFIARARWDTKERISVSGSVARQPLVRAVNRAIANLGIRPETIKA